MDLSSSSKNLCRWGLLGSAGIARKNWQSIKRSGNGRLVAVASRSAERSANYIAENQLEYPFSPAPEAMGSYEDLLARDDIDAVYIPLPTGVRGEWVKKAAAAGKHVMCEKPIGTTAEEAEELIEACREANVQFMDGVMFMHSLRLPAIREVLEDGESIGDIKRIVSQFSFLAPEEMRESDIRFNESMEPLGCLGDLGWYCIRFALWTMKYELPVEVSARILASAGDIPTEFSAEMTWPDGVSGSFYCSFDTEHQQWANISGTKGNLSIKDFVVPEYGNASTFEVSNPKSVNNGCDFYMESHRREVSVYEYSNSHETAQETNLFRNFADLVLSGEHDHEWGEISLKTQLVLEACLESARA